MFVRLLEFWFLEYSIADGFALARTRTFGGKHSFVIENFRRMSHVNRRLSVSNHAVKFSDFMDLMAFEASLVQ